MKKTRLISSLICIVFLTTIFFDVYAAKPDQDESKNIVGTAIGLSDEPEVSPGTGDSMQLPEISAEPGENAADNVEEENVQSVSPSPQVNTEVQVSEVPETESESDTEEPEEAEATPEVYINEDGAPFIETIENTEAQIVINDGDVLSVKDISKDEIQLYETNGQVMLMNDSDIDLESIIDVNIDINSIDHKTIVTGNDHVLMINSDGTVSAWGSNTYGQLGNGTNISSIEPVMVQGLSEIIEVTAGDGYSLAMDKNGEVYSWGRNSWGMLGNGSTLNTNVPNKINSLSGLNIVKVSTSGYHCLALANNGDVYAWGTNGNGQLGLGDREDISVPAIVQNLPSSIDIAAAGFSSYAVDVTGSVWSWGNNNSCKLGFTNSGDILSPNKTVIKDIESISTGYDHCLAIGEDGNIYSWGDNGFGQLGVTGITTYTPQKQDIGLSNVKNSFSKCHHSIAVTEDGKTYAWGRNDYGQLGIGTISDKVFEPTLVVENSFKTIAMDIYSTYAVSGDGNLYKWGYMPNTDISKYISGGSCVPLDIPTETRFVQVEAKRNSVVALDVNGDVYTWGDGAYDDLGHGNKDNVYYPKKVEGLPKIKQVAKGKNHTLVLDINGNIWGWGNNSSKEVDRFQSDHIGTPVMTSGINNVREISAGAGFSAAIKLDSTLWTWGNNNSGQLGMASANGESPVMISGVDCKYSTVECGNSFLISKYMYDNNDTTYDPYLNTHIVSCGENNYGQLGIGNTFSSTNLRFVSGMTECEICQISAGKEHVLSLSKNGSIYAWGSNSVGQLGFGNKDNKSIPEMIPGLSNIKYISASNSHSLAVTKGGKLYAWGEGREGQLGIGVKDTRRSPVLVDGIKNLDSVTGGASFSIALDYKGKLWSFGDNEYGQLGVISNIPQKIILSNDYDIIITSPDNNSNISADGDITLEWLPELTNVSIKVNGYNLPQSFSGTSATINIPYDDLSEVVVSREGYNSDSVVINKLSDNKLYNIAYDIDGHIYGNDNGNNTSNITSSSNYIDEPYKMTDGAIFDGGRNYSELSGNGLQWVQFDLGNQYPIEKINVWHSGGRTTKQIVYNDVIFQISNDPNFVDNVVTVFNNDSDNSAGLGLGTDEAYIESGDGKSVDCNSIRARYVRLYSSGNNTNINGNWYSEVEILSTVKRAYNLTTYHGKNVDLKLLDEDVNISFLELNKFIADLDSAYDSYERLTGIKPGLFNNGKLTYVSTMTYNYYGLAGQDIHIRKNYIKTALNTAIQRDTMLFEWLHEMGHCFNSIKWNTDDEHFTNFVLLYALHENPDKKMYYMDAGNYYNEDSMMEYYHRNYNNGIGKAVCSPFDDMTIKNNQYYTYTTDSVSYMFARIVKVIGWEPFRATFRAFVNGDIEDLSNSSYYLKLDAFLTSLQNEYNIDGMEVYNTFLNYSDKVPQNELQYLRMYYGADSVSLAGFDDVPSIIELSDEKLFEIIKETGMSSEEVMNHAWENIINSEELVQ